MATTWIDPRYTDLVQTFDALRERRRRQGPATRCRACVHGLGAVVMVDPTTKRPFVQECLYCSPST